MMRRREVLKGLLGLGAVAAAPPLQQAIGRNGDPRYHVNSMGYQITKDFKGLKLQTGITTDRNDLPPVEHGWQRVHLVLRPHGKSVWWFEITDESKA